MNTQPKERDHDMTDYAYTIGDQLLRPTPRNRKLRLDTTNDETIGLWVGEMSDGLLRAEPCDLSGSSAFRVFRADGLPLDDDVSATGKPTEAVAGRVYVPLRRIDYRFRTVMSEVASLVRFTETVIAGADLDHPKNEELVRRIRRARCDWQNKHDVK